MLQHFFRSSATAQSVMPASAMFVFEQAILAEGTIIMPQEKKLELPKYCESIYQTRRRPTRTIHIGKLETGSAHPVRLQTMTTTGDPLFTSCLFHIGYEPKLSLLIVCTKIYSHVICSSS